jgi:hypothetical protein
MTENENDGEIVISEKETENVLLTTLTNLAEGLGGIGASEKTELVLSISHLFQRLVGGQFLNSFRVEWNRYRQKGKVKDDYQYTEQHKACLLELLDFLENDLPDEKRFTILKKVFLVAASEEESTRESLLPQQFMKIARSLTTGEVILLTTVWDIAKNQNRDENEHDRPDRWLQNVAEKSGLKYVEIVEIHEKGMIEKKLITPRIPTDRIGIETVLRYRLTNLGNDFCSFFESYED